MDESDGLENRYGGNLIVGSNPTPSASFRCKSDPQMINLGVTFTPLDPIAKTGPRITSGTGRLSQILDEG